MKTLLLEGLIAFSCIYFAISQTDYCDPSLCQANTAHIACNNTGSFGPACTNAAVLDLSSAVAEILNKSNTNRDVVAGGNLSGFSSAIKMATMQYDAELSSMALLNAKRCVTAYDPCHNLPRFANSGQNALSFIGNNLPTASVLVIRAINVWFNDYPLVSQSTIDSFKRTSPASGRFTLGVLEKNIYIGCAAVTYTTTSNSTAIYIVCNYAANNAVGEPVYRSGSAASNCSTGTNPTYSDLCSLNETYLLN